MSKRHVWTIPDQPTKKGEFLLAQLGPLVQVELQVSEVDRRALEAIGEPVPAPRRGRALIDTGASISAVRIEVAELLGLRMVGEVPLVGQSGVSNRAPVYYGQIGFRGAEIPAWSSTLAGINIAGKTGDVIALLGRDFLRKAVFEYDGIAAKFSLRWGE